jgi:CheY-like chemotaxis protein
MNETILIVDDAAFSRTVMKQALFNAGFDNIL